MLEDPNDEPQYGERVPYVIARGAPGMRLVDRAVAPEFMLKNQCVLTIVTKNHATNCPQS